MSIDNVNTTWSEVRALRLRRLRKRNKSYLSCASAVSEKLTITRAPDNKVLATKSFPTTTTCFLSLTPYELVRKPQPAGSLINIDHCGICGVEVACYLHGVEGQFVFLPYIRQQPMLEPIKRIIHPNYLVPRHRRFLILAYVKLVSLRLMSSTPPLNFEYVYRRSWTAVRKTQNISTGGAKSQLECVFSPQQRQMMSTYHYDFRIHALHFPHYYYYSNMININKMILMQVS